jgi:hypothetical protein
MSISTIFFDTLCQPPAHSKQVVGTAALMHLLLQRINQAVPTLLYLVFHIKYFLPLPPLALLNCFSSSWAAFCSSTVSAKP